jgi:hypothetical protein
MAEIKIKFDLTFSRRFVTAVSAAAMMFCAVPELESESVTLSTYYPAPSGVYTNMITTSNTYLARDGGNVGIGTTAPGSKLDVNGNINGSGTVTGTGIGKFGGLVTSGANTLTTADPHVADILIGSDLGNRHDSTIMMWSNASALRLQSSADVLYLNTWNQALGTYNVALAAGTGATSTFNGPLSINSGVTATAAFKTSAGAGCSVPTSFNYPTPNGGSTAICAGQYVTTIAGFYTKYLVIPLDRGAQTAPPVNNQFDYMCCPCPPSGCTL